ncbi:hypothetical protein [Streptomyces griseorubiginosus]|uniref:Uncharacterized protein n=1 Tax=Streptomyces griseorubiginosus TaxID=67304 RepID=A0AAI8PP76_9ACTN|nr:hypothetical protein [Streptomyces griseorubiginosus]AYC39801.1 hypothetical protein DWG14_04044 [Streptomyces griseorubiginosus]
MSTSTPCVVPPEPRDAQAYLAGGPTVYGDTRDALGLDLLVVPILLGTAVMGLLRRAAWWVPGPHVRSCDRLGIKESDMPADDPVGEPVLVAAG